MKRSFHHTVGAVGFASICAWTGVLFLNRNAEIAHLVVHSRMGVVLLAACAVLWGSGWLAARSAGRRIGDAALARALCWLTALVFVTFSHQAFHYWAYRLLSVRALSGAVLYAALAAGLMFAVWMASRAEAVRFAVAISACAMLVMAVGNQWSARDAGVSKDVRTGTALATAQPSRKLSGENVYYIILDGYGGPDALRRSAGIDIDPFLAAMASWDLQSLRSSRSNYIVTHASIAATLEMDYVIDESSPRYRSRRDFFPESLSRAEPPEVVRRIGASGYRFLHIGNAWAPCHRRSGIECADGYAPEAAQAVEVLERYLAPTRLPDLAARAARRGAPEGSPALADLMQFVQDGGSLDKPSFYFVHHLVPHDPLNLDCTRSDQPMSKALYANAIRCVNADALKLTELIRRNDPRALIVFQADHGSDFSIDWDLPLARWSRDSIDERSSILNLIHLPEDCRQWLRPTLGPINTMRLVMACLARVKPDYVDERTYLTTYETAADFGLVRRVGP